MYAVFDFYNNEFHGTQIDAVRFKEFAVQADAFIDAITFGRAMEHPNDREVRMAACAAAEVFAGAEAAAMGVSGVNNDGFSMSFAGRSRQSIHKAAYQAARMFLPPGLLYAGVDI